MKKVILLLIFLLFIIGGCNSGNKKPFIGQNFQVKEDLQKTSDSIDLEIKRLEDMSVDIFQQTTLITQEINQVESSPILKKIKNYIDVIIEKTKQILIVKNNLAKSSTNLKIAKEKIIQIDKNMELLIKERNEAVKENNELKEDIKSRITSSLKKIVIGSIVGFGVFIGIGVFVNLKGGLIGAVSCLSTMVLALAVGQHIDIIAWVGLAVIIISVLIIGFLIYIQRKAIIECVETTEKTKEKLPEEAKNEIFGNGEDDGIAGILQSKSTKEIVKKEREKIKSKGLIEIIKKKKKKK